MPRIQPRSRGEDGECYWSLQALGTCGTTCDTTKNVSVFSVFRRESAWLRGEYPLLSWAPTEITDPPVGSPRLHGGEPAACRVEDADRNRPHQIEQAEAPHVAVGRRRVAHRVIREQPRVEVAFAQERHDERQHVDQRDVQRVVEERHPPEHESARATAPSADSNTGISAIVGPSVISRKSSEAGYFVVLRNEKSVCDHGCGSPYRLNPRSTRNSAIAPSPIVKHARSRRARSSRDDPARTRSRPPSPRSTARASRAPSVRPVGPSYRARPEPDVEDPPAGSTPHRWSASARDPRPARRTDCAQR